MISLDSLPWEPPAPAQVQEEGLVDLNTAGLEELTALLRAADLPLYGAALREDTADVREVDLRRCAMAVGSEGRGLSAAVLAACDKTVRIPMDPRCESLNAASAASVLLWEAARGEY